MEQENRRESVNVTFEGVKSTLTDVGQCYLCGNSRRSLMGYYRKFDTIGLVELDFEEDEIRVETFYLPKR